MSSMCLYGHTVVWIHTITYFSVWKFHSSFRVCIIMIMWIWIPIDVWIQTSCGFDAQFPTFQFFVLCCGVVICTARLLNSNTASLCTSHIYSSQNLSNHVHNMFLWTHCCLNSNINTIFLAECSFLHFEFVLCCGSEFPSMFEFKHHDRTEEPWC